MPTADTAVNPIVNRKHAFESASASKPIPIPPDWNSVPEELASRRQFVCWSFRKRFNKKIFEKWIKVPVNARTKRLAKSTDPETWSTFAEARSRCLSGAATDGIGFVFTADDPYCGIDPDNCRDPVTGEIDAWARELIDRFKSFSEVSPSGTGIHIIVRAKLPEGKGHNKIKLANGHTVEMYDRGRYFAMTFHRVGDVTEIRDGQAVVDALIAEAVEVKSGSEGVEDRPRAKCPPTIPASFKAESSAGAHYLSDAEIINIAMAAADGRKFAKLWGGDASDYPKPDGSPDYSSADLALCSILAFYTGPDRARLASLFAQSALYRPKWDRADYQQWTCDQALAGRTEFYDPQRRRSHSAGPTKTSPVSARAAMTTVIAMTAAGVFDGMPAGTNTPISLPVGDDGGSIAPAAVAVHAHAADEFDAWFASPLPPCPEAYEILLRHRTHTHRCRVIDARCGKCTCSSCGLGCRRHWIASIVQHLTDRARAGHATVWVFDCRPQRRHTRNWYKYVHAHHEDFIRLALPGGDHPTISTIEPLPSHGSNIRQMDIPDAIRLFKSIVRNASLITHRTHERVYCASQSPRGKAKAISLNVGWGLIEDDRAKRTGNWTFHGRTGHVNAFESQEIVERHGGNITPKGTFGRFNQRRMWDFTIESRKVYHVLSDIACGEFFPFFEGRVHWGSGTHKGDVGDAWEPPGDTAGDGS